MKQRQLLPLLYRRKDSQKIGSKKSGILNAFMPAKRDRHASKGLETIEEVNFGVSTPYEPVIWLDSLLSIHSVKNTTQVITYLDNWIDLMEVERECRERHQMVKTA